MGAGMSGLSCAITLERHGIIPTIFEKKDSVGDTFVHGEAMFHVFNSPVKDCLPYLSEKYHINLKALDEVDKLFVHSKDNIGTIDGKIGYLNVRGRHKNSYESQLEEQVKCNINFNSTYKYEELCKDFDYVVLATGDGEYASQLGNYRCDLTYSIKGATIQGEFITSNPHVWFNYEILPKGYAFLIPFSKKEANLVIAYPEYPNNMKLDINEIWKNFYILACNNLDQTFRITDSFQIRKYMIGICNKPKINNTYFVGNCFGAISPGLGFGQYTSILTGIYAAYDICGLETYGELAKPLFENYNHSLVLRRFLNNLTDDDLDFLIKNLDNKITDQLVDKACSSNSSIDLLQMVTPIMRLWNNYKKFKS